VGTCDAGASRARRQLAVAHPHAPEVLVRNIFYLALLGIAVEIVLMVLLPRIGF
jgi:hypothetical protein